MNKLTFLSEASIPLLYTKSKEIFSSWGYKEEDISTLTEWKKGAASISTLFTKNAVLLDLTESDNLKKFVELINDKKKNIFSDNWFGNGVIIITTASKGTKKITDLVNKSGGTVFSKRTPEEIKEETINSLNIKNEIKAFINNYIGTDYEMAFVIKNSINGLSKEEQKNLTYDVLYSLLPEKPGAIPPWELADNIFSLNFNNVSEKLDRSLDTIVGPVVTLFLKRKAMLLYEYILGKHIGLKTNKDIATKFKQKSPWVYNSFQKLNNLNLDTVEYIVKIIVIADSDLKGGKANTKNIEKEYIKSTISKIIIALRYNKPLENL